jgi:hypothetical protein
MYNSGAWTGNSGRRYCEAERELDAATKRSALNAAAEKLIARCRAATMSARSYGQLLATLVIHCSCFKPFHSCRHELGPSKRPYLVDFLKRFWWCPGADCRRGARNVAECLGFLEVTLKGLSSTVRGKGQAPDRCWSWVGRAGPPAGGLEPAEGRSGSTGATTASLGDGRSVHPRNLNPLRALWRLTSWGVSRLLGGPHYYSSPMASLTTAHPWPASPLSCRSSHAADRRPTTPLLSLGGPRSTPRPSSCSPAPALWASTSARAYRARS